MISINSFKKIVRDLHLDKIYDSVKECCHDARGGFLIPTSAKVKDSENAKYRHLPINWDLSPITKDDLPEEFSPQAVKPLTCSEEKPLICPMSA